MRSYEFSQDEVSVFPPINIKVHDEGYQLIGIIGDGGSIRLEALDQLGTELIIFIDRSSIYEEGKKVGNEPSIIYVEKEDGSRIKIKEQEEFKCKILNTLTNIDPRYSSCWNQKTAPTRLRPYRDRPPI